MDLLGLRLGLALCQGLGDDGSSAFCTSLMWHQIKFLLRRNVDIIF